MYAMAYARQGCFSCCTVILQQPVAKLSQRNWGSSVQAQPSRIAMGSAEYPLSHQLPEELQASLPSLAVIEAGLLGEW